MSKETGLHEDIVALVEKHSVDNLVKGVEIIEEESIRFALRTSATYKEAAGKLGIGKSTMYRKMKKYGIPKRRSY